MSKSVQKSGTKLNLPKKLHSETNKRVLSEKAMIKFPQAIGNNEIVTRF